MGCNGILEPELAVCSVKRSASVCTAPWLGVAVGGSCDMVGLRWWYSVSHACVWGFPDLVSDCLCVPNHHVSM